MPSLDRIESLIAQGNLKEALASLSELVAKSDELTRHRNATITLSARYHQLQRRRISGLISSGEAQITENQVRYNTLELIDVFRKEVGEPENNTSPNTDTNTDTNPNTDPPTENEGKLRILFLAANPVDQARTFVEFEFESIQKMFLREGFKNRLEIIPIMDTNPDNFITYILHYRPNIVHFSGHGSEEGLVLTDDKSKKGIPIPKERLADVFKLFKEVVGCVVLNACFSLPQAESIKEYISYVIGTDSKLTAGIATKFSSKFYEALGNGETIEFAFEFARVGVGLTDSRIENIKML